ncbi:GTPase [Nocardiopsis ansamitocini]|uniref:ATP-binding protein n=1 Tax=Nocardiopsis ansamitocini TaxID=1670832 RepID=A0A9W6P6G6_9ACTN|nr:GTPase [Nocardiopsis ansamitocini]GLU47917.1 ATP-binding protein [Nocardiopsis ansamitocini]
MTTHRNSAHPEQDPDLLRSAAPDADPADADRVEAPSGRPEAGGDAARPDWGHGWARPSGSWPAAEESEEDSYPDLRRAVDDHSGPQEPQPERPAAFSYKVPIAPAEPEPGPAAAVAELADEMAAEAERSAERPQQGRHTSKAQEAVPADSGGSDDPDDPDDPDQLAEWVGSLAGAVGEQDQIAGRRTGPISALPRDAVDTAAAPQPQESAPFTSGRTVPEPPENPRGGWVQDVEEDEGPSWETSPSAEDDDHDDGGEYRPSSGDDWQPMPATTRAELINRLDALATLVEIGRDHFAPKLIDRARGLLTHAGARLRLSADHTVIALAGGTGSGKSSLFNALSGLELSRVGITRPTTSSAHACVWGLEGADGLLDWLGVPPRHRHSRASELDKGDSELTGLILLDLPDHDSVRAAHTAEADHLIGAADLLVWVLDPQKYADAAVHHRYLAEMAGHGAVMVAVLNQVDRVEPEEAEELLTDLRRLLETESGVHPRVLTSSTITGEGLRDLRALLTETVAERRAAIDRLVADLEQVIVDFEEYGVADAEAGLSQPVRRELLDRLAGASGVAAIADATETSYERKGARRVGWPLVRWAKRLRRDPLRAVQLDFLNEDDSGEAVGPVGAQRVELDTAIVAASDASAAGLPGPWPKRVRAAGRSHLETLPDELGTAVAAAVPDDTDTPLWWGVVRVLQYFLVGVAGFGIVWLVTLAVSWFLGGVTGLAVLDDAIFMAFAAVLAASGLLLGWLTGIGCRSLVSVEAGRRRERVEEQGTERVFAIITERVVTPMERELADYVRYGQALGTARAKEYESVE